MTTKTQATRQGQAEANRYGRPMLLIATRDDWGKPTTEFVAKGMEDILYGVQLKHGLATIVGTLYPLTDDPDEQDEGSRMARSELAGLLGQDG